MKRLLCIRLPNGPSQRWVERCGRFSPTVGLEPTDDKSILLDITGLAHLFGGEAALCKSVVRDFARRGQNVRVAVADTIGAAWAVVKANEELETRNEEHTGPLSLRERARVRASCDTLSRVPGVNAPKPIALHDGTFVVIPAGAIPAFLDRLPIETLRLPDETVRLLHELGITTIGHVEALPRNELSSRFGPVLLMRLDQAFGRLDEPVRACPIPPTFEADWSAEHPTTRRETLEAALEHLIERVAAMLAHCGRGALRLECQLTFEILPPPSALGPFSLSVGLFQPTAAADHLYQLIRLQLERLRIPSPVTDVCVTATLTAPLEPRKQAMLFEFVGDDLTRQHSRQLATLVERLSSRLGREAVSCVRLRPEAQPELSWHYDSLVDGRRRRRARKTLPIELPPRPLRLLPRPVPLALSGWARIGCEFRSRHPERSEGSSVDLVEILRCDQDDNRENVEGGTSPSGHRPGTAAEQWSALLDKRRGPRTTTPFVPQGRATHSMQIVSFHFAGEEHQIAHAWGPERIETGWWRGRPVGRDYFRVETTTGRRFWLFCRLRDEKWFLQGMFE